MAPGQRQRWVPGLLSVAIAVLLHSTAFGEVSPARADGSDQDRCNADTGSLDSRVSSCTRAIDLGIQQDDRAALLYLNRGNAWYSEGNYDQAFADYQTASRLNQGWSRPHVGLGNILRDKTDSAGALAQYEQALQLDPGNTKAYYNRAQLFTTAGDLQKAAADYDVLLGIDPTDSNSYYRRSFVWLDLQQPARAVSDLNKSVELSPGNATYLQARGWARFLARDADAALADLTEAIRLNPNLALAHFQRANILVSQSLLDRAIVDYSDAIRLAPDKSSESIYRYHRGLAFKRKGQFDQAIQDFDRAIALDRAEKLRDPGHQNCCFGRSNLLFVSRGDTHLAMRQFDAAIADFDEALKFNPNDSSTLISRGDAWFGKSDFDHSIVDYTEAIRIDPANARAWTNRGNARFGRDRDGAISDYSEAIRIDAKNVGVLISRGNVYHAQRRYDLAIKDYDEALRVDPTSFTALNNRGNSWLAKQDSEKAVEDYRAALRINPDFAAAYSSLGRIYQKENRYDEAEKQYEHAVAALEKTGKSADLPFAGALAELAWLKSDPGKFPKVASDLYERSLAIHEKVEGGEHVNVASALAFLASAYSVQARYQDAEKALQRALAIAERSQDLAVSASVYFSLGILYGLERSYTKEQSVFEKALAAYEKQSPVDENAIAGTLTALANAYWQAGKYLETAQAAERALSLLERSAPQSYALALALESLAAAYHGLGRDAEAEGLIGRAIAISDTSLGPENPGSASARHILGDVYYAQGKYQEAKEAYTRVLRIREQVAPDSLDTSQTIVNLGDIYRAQGNFAEAERLYDKGLAMRERFLPDSTAVAWSLIGLGKLYRQTGRNAEAKKSYERALAIDEKVLGPNHPDLAYLFDDMAILNRSTGNLAKALDYSRRATTSLISFAAEQSSSTRGATGYGGLISQRPDYFIRHITYLASAAASKLDSFDKLGREAFEIAQWSNFSATAAAVHQLSARFAAGDDSLALLVRQQQDSEAAWREREIALSDALSDSKNANQGQAVKAAQAEIADLEASLAQTTHEIEGRFPEYAALSRPKPIAVEEIQQALSADDALAFFVIGSGSSFIFALTRDQFQWRQIPLGTEDLTREVAAFRHGLDVEAIGQLYDVVQDRQAAKLFDLGRAHELYRKLFSPIAQLVEGKPHLIVVPAGPLTALPFHLLITDEPDSAVPERLSGYRDAAWLAKRQSISASCHRSEVSKL